jgi:uncharacterized protein (DUF58 family)
MRKVRAIEVRARRRLNEELIGHYHSIFKGRGMSFDQVREYQPGDDVRLIDWNVSARTNHTYVKQYVEERDLTVLLAVDASASMVTGSASVKRDRAAEVAAVLALSALRNNDRVGLVMLTDRVERLVPPKKGRGHVLRLVTEILDFQPRGTGTDLAAGLQALNQMYRRKAVVFLLSDGFARGYEQALGITARRHDVNLFRLQDPLDRELPAAGLVSARDPETGREVLADWSDPRLRLRFREEAAKALARQDVAIRRQGADVQTLPTDGEYFPLLVRFFSMRARRY